MAGANDARIEGFRHTASLVTLLSRSGEGLWTRVAYRRDIWIGPDGSGLIIEVPTSFPPSTTADGAATAGIRRRFAPHELTFVDFKAVPRRSSGVRSLLHRRANERGEAGPIGLWNAGVELLAEMVMPPDLRTFVYEYLSSLPTVRSLAIGGGHRLVLDAPYLGFPAANTLDFDADGRLVRESRRWLSRPPQLDGADTAEALTRIFLTSEIVLTLPPDEAEPAGPRD